MEKNSSTRAIVALGSNIEPRAGYLARARDALAAVKGGLDLYCNLDSVDLFPVAEGSEDEALVRALLRRHVELTSSPKAERILRGWSSARHCFVKVVPAVQV